MKQANYHFVNYAKIGNLAKIFLQNYYSTTRTKREFPIDLINIVRFLGYTIQWGAENKSILAYTDIIHKAIFLLMDTKNNSLRSRIRFTIAHEIGHIVLHEQLYLRHFSETPQKLTQVVGNPILEREADTFASHLIIPRQQIRKKIIDNFGYCELYFKNDVLMPSISKAILAYVQSITQASESAVIIALRDSKIIRN